ncbi:ALF repeat-containing protein [Verrucosispora sp. WMMD573]|uniref:ALF repeat-containing protein n=1 Tax=Verrucosispora sp. WMMD573 TaxID=3015149 RepID=UPI00248BC96A|nr:ALF repeat-containing protein [Verrucosispora sp. WMMD573]WBB52259.1 ALF repeat-containing protein [Verrucosispora sp. WMMD573]
MTGLMVLALLVGLLPGKPARADDPPPLPADRAPVVQAWLNGGVKVRAAAESALLGPDDQVRAFLNEGWAQAQRLDERDAVVAVIAEAGPAVRAAAQQALDAFDAGDVNALSAFLNAGWQQAASTDTRVQVNQLMAAGGDQVKAAAQQALDSSDPAVWREFLDAGWQSRWLIDQRVRVNQAMATGGPQVKAAGQRALDAGTPEALESFLDHGWAVAAARDQEAETLTALYAQAQAQGELAEQETQRAKNEAARAKEAAAAARVAADKAAAATAAARHDTAEAAAQAKRAAVAAQKAAAAAKVAVQAAASANRAARAAAAAAQRAASAASQAERAAAKAYNAAAQAATDASKADAARVTAQEARDNAKLSRDFATTAHLAGQAIQAGLEAIDAAVSAANQAKLAADANDDATRYANEAGANASAAVAAARQARADADRALRAANAAQTYLQAAAKAAFAARDAANRAAERAEQAAAAAIDAANHAGDAAQAARRSSEAANAATVAAQAAVETAGQAIEVYDAARAADAERLAVVKDQGVEAARQANAQYEQAQLAARWDALQTEQRDAETNQLIAEVLNPATDPVAALGKARKVALNLSLASGVWTRQAAMAALGGSDVQVLEFVRSGIAEAAGQDDRVAVGNLAVTDNIALRDAALAALNSTDAAVSEFLRTQNYPGRYIQDRVRVNQILAGAKTSGDSHLAQKAQEALDSGDGQKLREFLAVGQYTAAVIGQRVRVNAIMASADSGPEVKAAAQIALDGPPPGIVQFLEEGRHAAAERDQDAAAHLAVVASLVERINGTAQTAVQNAMEAQKVAAQARNDAAAAANYASQAAKAAQDAANFAAKAAQYANQANASAERAAASVKTAKEAATRASVSARSAIRSASWAVLSHERALHSAKEAQASAKRAYDSAVAAGESAEEAVAAANQAYHEYELAVGLEVAKCQTEYAKSATADLERLVGGTEGDFARNCVANVIADPAELAKRAYTNAAYCSVYPDGSQHYKNCIATVLAPDFLGNQTLIMLTEILKGVTAILIPVAAAVAIGCIATIVCGVVAGSLLTIGEAGLNVYKLINGDQSLADALLKLGQVALETLIFAGLAKIVHAGFQTAKQLHNISRAANAARHQLAVADFARVQLVFNSCVRRHSLVAGGAALRTDASDTLIGQLRLGQSVSVVLPETGPKAGNPVWNVLTARGTALAHNADCFGLTDLGGGWFRSPAGLDYGPNDDKFGHRILHVLAHAYEDRLKPNHGVFDTGSKGLLETVDEAWQRKGLAVSVLEQGARTTYVIPMGRRVGYNPEEDFIQIVVEHGNEVITAFPRKWP